MANTDSLPLFPLHAVLLPGASLGLRIFEPRYLDMVRDCSHKSAGFGVCLILDGDEAGTPAAPAAYGTEARIEDFGSTDDGLLVLQVRGARRFRVSQTRIRDNGLIVGDVEWLARDPDDELQPQHGLLAVVLRNLIERIGGEYAKAPTARFDEAAWVGWRLAELLPLDDARRQMLLQQEDPHVRLDQLLEMLQ